MSGGVGEGGNSREIRVGGPFLGGERIFACEGGMARCFGAVGLVILIYYTIFAICVVDITRFA